MRSPHTALLGFVLVVGVLGLALHRGGRSRSLPSSGAAAPVRAAAPGEPELDARLAGARAALARDDLPAAFRACRIARQKGAPARAILPVEAEVFRRAGYLDREISALRQWATVATDDAMPWQKLFYIDLDLGWRCEAGEAVKRATSLAPQDPHTLVIQAISFDRAHDSPRALAGVDQALRLDPANGDLANLRATLLMKMARNAEAERVLRVALARDPANAPDRLALAHALLAQGRMAEAIAQIREVERREPDNVEAAYQLGVLAMKQGDLAEAQRELERAAAADAGFSHVAWYLGRLYLRQGRAAEGRKLLRMFQRMDANALAFETALEQLEAWPRDPALHERLARFHLAAGELPQAVVELRRVLELQPGNARAQHDLAAALNRQGRLTEARQLQAERLR
jgi:Flp pilus assembly protein TadD